MTEKLMDEVFQHPVKAQAKRG